MPHFLVIDQPSQAFFPRDRDAGGDLDELSDVDRENTRRLYRLMFDVVSSLEGRLQVIAMDHAEFRRRPPVYGLYCGALAGWKRAYTGPMGTESSRTLATGVVRDRKHAPISRFACQQVKAHGGQAYCFSPGVPSSAVRFKRLRHSDQHLTLAQAGPHPASVTEWPGEARLSSRPERGGS